MPVERFLDEERRFYLAGPMAPTDAADFHAHLGLTTPMFWEKEGDFERFCLAEFQAGTYCTQFARLGTAFYTRIVDALDESTWITADHIREREGIVEPRELALAA